MGEEQGNMHEKRLSTNWLARRRLLAIYDIVDGQAGATFTLEQIRDYANRIGLVDMTEAEFESYRARTIARVKNTNQRKN